MKTQEEYAREIDEIISEMTDLVKSILLENGGIIKCDSEELVILTMIDEDGDAIYVNIGSIELVGTCLYANDADSQCGYIIYPEHIYWVLEFITTGNNLD